MFTIFGATLTLAQIISAIPEIISAVKAAIAVYQTLVAVNNLAHDQAMQESMGMLGKALAKLFYDAIGHDIPLPHRMTPEEEKLWMDHASQAGSG